MKKLILLIMLVGLSGYLNAQWTVFGSTQGFESVSETTLDSNGNVVDVFGQWIKPASDVYTNTNATYVYAGSQSLRLKGPAGNSSTSYKDRWGAITTKMLDCSSADRLRLTFRYVVINNSATTATASAEDNSFSVEYSTDGGTTYQTMQNYPMSTLHTDFYKTSTMAWAIGDAYTPVGSALSNVVKVRIKCHFNDDANYSLYVDQLTLRSENGTISVNTLEPADVQSSLTKTLTMNAEGFEGTEAAPWGVWLDGGGDAYTTTSHVINGTRVACIKDYYDNVSLEDSNDEFSGEKEYYSSIYTQNLDFRPYEELQLNFSFKAVGLEFVPENILKYDGTQVDDSADGFSLYVSRDAGINFTHVKRWTAGVDFDNDIIYEDISIVVPNTIFTGDLIPTSGFTSDVVLKLQAEGDDDTDYVYIDDIYISGHGSTGEGAYISASLNFGGYQGSYLTAQESTLSVYDYINNNLVAPENLGNIENNVTGLPCIYGAVEHSDDTHTTNEKNGITNIYDSSLGKLVYAFNIYTDVDTDRCKTYAYSNEDIVGVGNPDRQRIEIKTYDQSQDFQKGVEGETHIYSWKFKLPTGFKATDNFTHLHQLKSKGGDASEESMPLITLTAQGEKYEDDGVTISTPQKLNLRYSPDDTSQRTLHSVDLSPFLGKWVQAHESVTFGEWGQASYRLQITDIQTGDELMVFETHSLRMWKTGADFVRAKWGIYRSLIQKERLRDEELMFADIAIVEVDETFDVNSIGNLFTQITGQVDEQVQESNTENDNIALLGTATQSSTGYGGLPERAIDGNTSGVYNDDSVTHTSAGIGEWWELELDQSYSIGDIVLFNRTDCCTDRLTNFTVNLLDENQNITFTYTSTTEVDVSRTINADGANASYLRVIQNNNSSVSLAEVEVYKYTGAVTFSEGDIITFNNTSSTIDPTKIYHIYATTGYLASDGESIKPYVVELDNIHNVPAEDLEWKFIQGPSYGLWYVQRAYGGSLPRLAREVISNYGITDVVRMKSTINEGVNTQFSWLDNSDLLFFDLEEDGPSNSLVLEGLTDLDAGKLSINNPLRTDDISFDYYNSYSDENRLYISEIFQPDTTKVYHLEASNGMFLASSGESEDAYSVNSISEATSSQDLEWEFVRHEDGLYHIQRAAGGTKPRLRTDGTALADMDLTSSNGTWTQYMVQQSTVDSDKYFITATHSGHRNKRLQLNTNGNVSKVSDDITSLAVTFDVKETSRTAEYGKIDFTHLYQGKTVPLNVAHRGNWGAPGLAENSDTAVLKSQSDSTVDWIEIDLKPAVLEWTGNDITDLTTIIQHDDLLHRLVSSKVNTYVNRSVYEFTEAMLSGLPLQDQFGNITTDAVLTLEQFFEFVKNSSITKPINLDISNKAAKMSNSINISADGDTDELNRLNKQVGDIVFLQAVNLILKNNLENQFMLKSTYNYDDPIWGHLDPVDNKDLTGEDATVRSILSYYNKSSIMYTPKVGEEVSDLTTYFDNWLDIAKVLDVSYPHPATVVGMEIRLKNDETDITQTQLRDFIDIAHATSVGGFSKLHVGVSSGGITACEGAWLNDSSKRFITFDGDYRASVEWLTDRGFDYIITDSPEHVSGYKGRSVHDYSTMIPANNTQTNQDIFTAVYAVNGGFSIYNIEIVPGTTDEVIFEIKKDLDDDGLKNDVIWRLGINSDEQIYINRLKKDGKSWDVVIRDPRETGAISGFTGTTGYWLGISVQDLETRLYIGSPDGKFDCMYLDYGLRGTVLEGQFGLSTVDDTWSDPYPTNDYLDYDLAFNTTFSGYQTDQLICRTDMFVNAYNSYFTNLGGNVNLDPINIFSYLNDVNPYFEYTGFDESLLGTYKDWSANNQKVFDAEVSSCIWTRESVINTIGTNNGAKQTNEKLIDAENDNTKTVLYPNPSKGIVNVALGQRFTDDRELTVALYDLTGRLVVSKKIQRTSGMNTISWDTATESKTLPNGIYIFRLIGGSSQNELKGKIIMDCGCKN